MFGCNDIADLLVTESSRFASKPVVGLIRLQKTPPIYLPRCELALWVLA